MSNDKKADVVMSFKSDGEIKLNQTIKELNAVMNTAAKQYRAQMAAMDENARTSDKLAAEQHKLSTQYEAAQKRTEKLTEEYKRMKEAGTENTAALAKQAGKVADAERAEASLKKQLDNANHGLTEQGKKSLDAKDKLAGLKKESEQLDSKQKSLTGTFKREQSELRKNATETEKNNLKKKQLGEQLTLTKDKVRNLDEQLRASEAAFGKNAKETNELRGKLDEAKASENNFSKELETTNKALKKQGNMSDDSARKIQKIGKAGEKIEGVGTKITAGVTTPIIGLGAASVKAFDDLHNAEAAVIRQTGATGKAADELKQSFERIHEQTPADMESVGKALGGVHTEMGLTGKSAEAASLQFLKYAKVNNQDVAESVTDVSRMMGDAGIKSSDYGKVLDQLTVASQKSGINVSELAQSCTKFGAPMRALGVDTQHSIAMFSAWHKAGVNTDIAFSGMKKAISQWGKQGKDSGKEFQSTLEKIKGAPTIADATSLAIKNFGAKAGPDLADAIKGGRFEISQYTDALKNSGGQLNKTAEASASPMSKMKTSMNKISDAGAKLGHVLITSIVPTITQVVQHVTKWAEAFQKLSPHTQKLIIKIGLLAAAIGPLIVAFGTVMGSVVKIHKGIILLSNGFKLLKGVSGIAGLMSSMGGLLGAVAPFLPLIIGVTAAIAGIVLVIKHWSQITAFCKKEWSKFSKWFGKLWKGIGKGVHKAVKAITEYLKKWGGSVVSVVSGPFHKVATFFSKHWNNVKKRTVKVFESITSFLRKWGALLLVVISGPLGWIALVVYHNWDKIKKSTEKAWNGVKNAIHNVVQSIHNVIHPPLQVVHNFVVSIWDKVHQATEKVWNKIKNAVESVAHAIHSVISSVFNVIHDVVSSIWNSISSITSDVWNGIKGGVSTVVHAVQETVSSVFNAIHDLVSNIWNAIKGAIEGPINAAKDAVSTVVNAIKDAVGNAFNGLVGTVEGIWNGIKDAIVGPIQSAEQIVKNIVDSIKDMVSSARDAASNMVGGIGDFFGGLFSAAPMPQSAQTVAWHAEGGIFTKPTLLQGSNRTIHGVGEAGPEAVLPLNEQTLEAIGKGVGLHMTSVDSNRPIVLNVDGRTFARFVGPYFSDYMQVKDATDGFSHGRRI